MAVVIKKSGAALVVHLGGELDLHTAGPFREVVSDALAQDPKLRHLVLMMDNVTFIDSSGIGAILGRYREVREKGGHVAAVGLQTPVKKVFDLSGISRVISLYDSEGQALASL